MFLIRKLHLVAVCLFLLAGPSWAAFDFHPSLFVEEAYNDNINSSSDNEEDDWITTIQPGISLEYDSRSVTAVIDYSLRYLFYKENSEDNLEEFEDVQQANAMIDFFEGRPFTLHLSETISREALDETDDNELSESNRSTVYHLTVVPEYDLRLSSTLLVIFGYEFDHIVYVEDEGDDSIEHTGRVTVVKDLSDSTSVNAGYAYRIFDADDDADFDRHDYSAGIDYNRGDRISVSVSGGYSDIEYDSGYTTDNINWAASLSYRQSAALLYTTALSQDYVVSASDGLTETLGASLGAVYEKDSTGAELSTFWEDSDYILDDREDRVLGIRGSLSRPLAANLTAIVEAGYERGWYDDSGTEEDVNRLTAGLSFEYVYRRLTASLGYSYRNNDSDIDTNDYITNIITLSGTVLF
jgi:hypothetical protein